MQPRIRKDFGQIKVKFSSEKKSLTVDPLRIRNTIIYLYTKNFKNEHKINESIKKKGAMFKFHSFFSFSIT